MRKPPPPTVVPMHIGSVQRFYHYVNNTPARFVLKKKRWFAVSWVEFIDNPFGDVETR